MNRGGAASVCIMQMFNDKEFIMNTLKAGFTLIALMGLAASMRAQDTGVYTVPPPPATKLGLLNSSRLRNERSPVVAVCTVNR